MPDKKTPPPLPPDALSRPTAAMRPNAPHSPEQAMPSPWDSEVLAPTPPPVTKSPFGGATWMNNAAYPLVKPEHAEELEQNAAVNEFGLKQPRAQAEAEAYAGYKKRQHTEAAAHHLAGMKAADAAGDKEAARRHSLMYNLHSKAMGHEPVGPAHPDVVGHLAGNPAKVYKYKAHHGDQLALAPSPSASASSEAPKAPGIASSAPGPMLGKNEREALYTIWAASQALLKGEGGVQTAKLTDTATFHGAASHLGPSTQVDKGKHTRRPSPPRTAANYAKDEMDPKTKAADRAAKASKTTCTKDGCGNYKPYYANTCSECNRKDHYMGKGELKPRSGKPAPCICDAYSHPHRVGGGKCGKGK